MLVTRAGLADGDTIMEWDASVHRSPRELYCLSTPHIEVPDVDALRDRIRATVGALA